MPDDPLQRDSQLRQLLTIQKDRITESETTGYSVSGFCGSPPLIQVLGDGLGSEQGLAHCGKAAFCSGRQDLCRIGNEVCVRTFLEDDVCPLPGIISQ